MTIFLRSCAIALATAFAMAACERVETTDPEALLPGWKLEEVLRIGSTDDADQALTRIVGPVIGPDGQIYVGQPQQGEIRIFNSDGQLSAIAGGKGNGPGEFISPIIAIGLSGDSLYATGFGGRFSLFSLQGTHLRTTVYKSTDPQRALPVGILARLSDGSMVGTPARPAGSQDPVVYLRIDPSGAPIDTLFRHSEKTSVGRSGDRATFSARHPFPAYPLFVVDPTRQRMAIVERHPAELPGIAEFRVTEITITGDTLYSTPYSYPPLLLPSSVADSAIEALSKVVRNIEPIPQKAEQLAREWVPKPSHYVPVDAVRYSEDGSLWLRRGGPRGSQQRWRVHGPMGKTEAIVTVPPGVDVRYVEAGYVWGVSTDHLDVPYLTKYRIIRPSVQ